MSVKKAEVGARVVSQLTWGAHICQFYRTREDLLEVLLPYWQDGLRSNHLCVWIVGDPLGVSDAILSLIECQPDAEQALESGQLTVFEPSQFYRGEGQFDVDRVLALWELQIAKALSGAYEGVRAAGNMAWAEKTEWEELLLYEGKVQKAILPLHMIALCSYPIADLTLSDMVAVGRVHSMALIKKWGLWLPVEPDAVEFFSAPNPPTDDRFVMDASGCLVRTEAAGQGVAMLQRAQAAATECPKSHRCMTTMPDCRIDHVKAGLLHLRQEDRQDDCPYCRTLGDDTLCGCPLRKVLHSHYGL